MATMLSLHSTMLAFTLLATSAIALPAPASSHSPRIVTEEWNIPTMELHMMTKQSGLPGGGNWPEDSKYPSTIDFEIQMPGQIAHCHAEFANGTLPDDLGACSSDGSRVRSRMEEYTGLGPRRMELAFVLRVFKVDKTLAGQSIVEGEVAITANEPAAPTSYLTCLEGPPFDGLRCKLMGVMSNHEDLVIEPHLAKYVSVDPSAPLTAV